MVSIPSSTSSAPSTSVSTLDTGTQCVNVISKYLVQYVPAATQKDKSSSTRVTGSQVLTSAEGVEILRGKEEKKQKKKDKRKKERLDKWREKDKLAKRKRGSRQNRTKHKPSKDQHTSQNDVTAVPVAPTTASNTDDTTQGLIMSVVSA